MWKLTLGYVTLLKFQQSFMKTHMTAPSLMYKSGRQTYAACATERKAKIFLPARFWGRSRADLLLEPQCAALLPSCARQM